MKTNYKTFLATALLVIVLLFVIWHFGIFPNLITTLKFIEWVEVTEEFTTALYWLAVFLILFIGCRSSKLEFS